MVQISKKDIFQVDAFLNQNYKVCSEYIFLVANSLNEYYVQVVAKFASILPYLTSSVVDNETCKVDLVFQLALVTEKELSERVLKLRARLTPGVDKILCKHI